MQSEFRLFLIFLILSVSSLAFAADGVRVDALAPLGAAPVSDDIYVINDTATNVTKSVTTSYLFQYINAVLDGTNLEIGDGGTTDFVRIANDGKITLHGDARIERHQPISAGRLVKHGANDPTLDDEGLYTTQDYQAGAIQELFHETNIPYRWAGGDLHVEIFWFMDGNAATSAKFVRWGVGYKSTAVGEAVAGAGTSFTQDVANLEVVTYTAGTLMATEMTVKILGTALDEHDVLAIRIYRDGVADDCADEARLVATRVHFVMDKFGKPL